MKRDQWAVVTSWTTPRKKPMSSPKEEDAVKDMVRCSLRRARAAVLQGRIRAKV